MSTDDFADAKLEICGMERSAEAVCIGKESSPGAHSFSSPFSFSSFHAASFQGEQRPNVYRRLSCGKHTNRCWRNLCMHRYFCGKVVENNICSGNVYMSVQHVMIMCIRDATLAFSLAGSAFSGSPTVLFSATTKCCAEICHVNVSIFLSRV